MHLHSAPKRIRWLLEKKQSNTNQVIWSYSGSIQLLYLGLHLAKRLMLILASTFVCQCRLKLVFWILWNIKNKLRNILNNLCKVKLPLLVKIYKTLYLTISSSTATSWQIFPRDCINLVCCKYIQMSTVIDQYLNVFQGQH